MSVKFKAIYTTTIAGSPPLRVKAGEVIEVTEAQAKYLRKSVSVVELAKPKGGKK